MALWQHLARFLKANGFLVAVAIYYATTITYLKYRIYQIRKERDERTDGEH